MATPARVLANHDADTRARLTLRSDRAGLSHLVKHIALIAALMIYVASDRPLWWAMMLPLGIALAFLFTLQHECTHQTPFKTRRLNEVIGHACGAIIIQPFGWFRAFHMAHHKYTNDPDRDPELQGEAKPESWAAFAWHLSTLGYWGGKLRILWWTAMGRFDPKFVSQRACPRLRRESQLMIALYAALFLFTLTVSPILLWLWLVPITLGFPVLRLYLLAEHGRCPQVANMFENSRTTLTNRVVNLIAWNMPYHAEHHAYPNVPFHKLPDAHAIAAPYLGELTDGYIAFTKSYVKPL